MKKFLFVLLITGLTLSACASATPANTSPAPATNTKAAVPTLASPANTQPTASSAATAATKKISTEFTPSDPKSVKLAAGKPQLVEFFAFW